MSEEHVFVPLANGEVASSTGTSSGPDVQPQISEGADQQGQGSQGMEEEERVKERKMEEEELEEEEDDSPEEEEEVTGSAMLEPSTLPWPGDKETRVETENNGASSESATGEQPESNSKTRGGSRDLSEDGSKTESDRNDKAKWRESMPEGERWRDEVVEVDVSRKGDGSLADDEDDEEVEEDESGYWMAEKAALVFTPQVNILRPSSKVPPEESVYYAERDAEKEAPTESALPYYPEWTEQEDKYLYLCEHSCSEKVKLSLGTAAAVVLFPLLVWGGYVLLPFDAPLLESAPLRLIYTLRCSLFAVVPIVLGVVVQGVARLRYGELKPLCESKLESREVAVHWHYVNDSMALFLVYFLQLAVMASYVSQDLLKLVPLLTIVFAFGRLIYWLCLSMGSSVRGLGFGLSFFPMLAMLGANLYFVCLSLGQGAVFDVAPPTTAAPPRQRWWG
ncbi:transmembrane protein 79 [Lampris incognitus]|uniref:transmembrane protein 79 n=1 Tax=Lampris incognitus TaxID=2546036 RepID=UPI0024B583EB|nr:transmembrane protein 79 [Lampris incognitus]